MNVFKLMSITTGVIITVGAAYAAQKKVDTFMNEDINDECFNPATNFGTRATTAFTVATAVGGVISAIINQTYRHIPRI
ncbi:hypothetical protein RHO13_09475 [Orbus wheelerorum]|uniref:hypothetical protein n=1 Tax=Orbus wheelerorum TaxID=3074111 RepID=UPI00370D7B3D